MSEKELEQKSGVIEPKGIGGWLLVPIAGVFYAIFEAGKFFINESYVLFEPNLWVSFITPNTLFYHSYWFLVLIFGGIMQVGLAIIPVIALVAIYKRKRFTPKIMISIYMMGILLVSIDLLLGEYFFSQINNDFTEQLMPESIKKFIGVAISAAIWIPYFIKSKRVKNTFTE